MKKLRLGEAMLLVSKGQSWGLALASVLSGVIEAGCRVRGRDCRTGTGMRTLPLLGELGRHLLKIAGIAGVGFPPGPRSPCL